MKILGQLMFGLLISVAALLISTDSQSYGHRHSYGGPHVGRGERRRRRGEDSRINFPNPHFHGWHNPDFHRRPAGPIEPGRHPEFSKEGPRKNNSKFDIALSTVAAVEDGEIGAIPNVFCEKGGQTIYPKTSIPSGKKPNLPKRRKSSKSEKLETFDEVPLANLKDNSSLISCNLFQSQSRRIRLVEIYSKEKIMPNIDETQININTNDDVLRWGQISEESTRLVLQGKKPKGEKLIVRVRSKW